MKYRVSFLTLWLLLIPLIAHAQTTGTNMVSTQFDTSDFPQWAKDLRRGEIVAFGSFPFTIFFASVIMDTYRWSNHSWDNRYAPFPIKSAGAVDMTQDEQIITLTAAIAGSVLISLVDFFIVRHKRNKKNKALNKLPGETPIIIRKPLADENPGQLFLEEPVTESGSP